MMDLVMNFDTDECLVTAMFDKGNRNDTMEAIDNIIPFLKGDADMIGLVCNTIRKLFCMSDEGYEIFLMDLEDYKAELEVFLRCSYVYFIPTMATVILAGRVDAGWYEPYFVGNKFLLTYYFLVMFCSWGIIHIEEIQNTVKAKVKVVAFCVVGIVFSGYLYCTTGVVCYLTVLILMLVIPIRKILEKPLSIAISIVLSGALPLGMTAILSIPRVNALLLAINETATMNARVRIYEILMSIITQKYWLGYGYNTLIVKERLYSNAQNGMLHIIVQFGMLGAATLVLLCYIATRNRYKRNKDVVEWCEFWLFALIVAGIIEITFGVFFYVFLALINCATNAKEERRDEDAIY